MGQGEPGALTWWYRWLENRGLTDQTIAWAGLSYDEEKKAIRIPYFNPNGKVRQVRYRLLDGHIKYLTGKGETQHLYNVRDTAKENVFLCEGEFDTMLLHQMGLHAVGVPGVNAFKQEWRFLFAYCDEVSIVFDGDEPGREGSDKIARYLGPLVSKLRLIRLPEGMDVTDMHKQNRKELETLLK